MRKPHYWRKPTSSPCPTSLIIVDTESWFGERAKVDGGELQTLRLGCAMAYRFEHCKRTRVAEIDFTESDDFWVFVEGRLSPHRTTYIVGHNLSYDLGILNGWKWLTSINVEVEKHIIEGGILLITGTCRSCKFVMCDTFNWFKCSLESIGEANGVPKMKMPDQGDDNYRWYDYCRRDVEATAAGIDSLIRYVKCNELGPFQPTIASLAFSVYRQKYMTQKTLVHNCQTALDLERASYYGGMVDTPLIGKHINGPIHELDVVSMYPNVCCQPLPTMFRGVLRRPSPADVKSRLKDYICIADVVLNTSAETYPVRRIQNVYHCQGEYRTVLADAEFRRAWEGGRVRYVWAIAWYKGYPIFEEYMRQITAEKAAHRKAERYADEMIAKYLGNSLYGKTGQLSPRWLTWNQYALETIEKLHGLDAGTLKHRYNTPPIMYTPEMMVILLNGKLRLQARQYWSEVEVSAGRSESRDSVPSIASCVTSTARVQLQEYHRTTGRGEYYYSDTDSIWTSDKGLSLLLANGSVGADVLGKLSCKRTVDSMTVYGRKDYVFAASRRTKGRKKLAVDIDDTTFAQLHFPSAKTQLTDGPWGGVFVREAIKELRRVVDHCHVNPDGTTAPFQLPADESFL